MTYAYRYKVNEKKYPEVVKKLLDEKSPREGGKGNGIAFYITQLILNDLQGKTPVQNIEILKPQSKPAEQVEEIPQNTTPFEQKVEKEVELQNDDIDGLSL
jgi:hypothetical protein